MKHKVQIKRYSDDKVIEEYEYSSERLAEKADNGINRNLNHNEYYTVIEKPPESSETEGLGE